jgi:hypothetical protein
MRRMVGVVLVVVGAVGLWIGGIPYTERETYELGPIEASADVEREIEIPPLLAGAVMALGVGLAVYGAGKGGS